MADQSKNRTMGGAVGVFFLSWLCTVVGINVGLVAPSQYEHLNQALHTCSTSVCFPRGHLSSNLRMCTETILIRL